MRDATAFLSMEYLDRMDRGLPPYDPYDPDDPLWLYNGDQPSPERGEIVFNSNLTIALI